MGQIGLLIRNRMAPPPPLPIAMERGFSPRLRRGPWAETYPNDLPLSTAVGRGLGGGANSYPI